MIDLGPLISYLVDENGRGGSLVVEAKKRESWFRQQSNPAVVLI